MKKLDILLEKYKQCFGEPCIPNKLDLYGKKNRVKMLERILERGIKLEASPDEWMNYYESYFKKECPVPTNRFRWTIFPSPTSKRL